jgi:hypothetical protein
MTASSPLFVNSTFLAKRWGYCTRHCLRICRVYNLAENRLVDGGRPHFWYCDILALEKRRGIIRPA